MGRGGGERGSREREKGREVERGRREREKGREVERGRRGRGETEKITREKKMWTRNVVMIKS